ncbi:retrotransposon protein, putative, ty1-copia subclass [Tanacetum coccineum]
MCIFIGYPKETMGYYFYFSPENKIVVARYVKFFEKSLITQKVSGRAIDLEEIQDEDTSPSKITSEIPMEVEEAGEHSLGDLNEPTSYKAAMLDLEYNNWLDAMNTEMQSIIDNMVWVLVDIPSNCKTVGSKWIFKKKTDIDGIVHTYKARLVAKGYTQLYGVDYEETFSPVADIRSKRKLQNLSAPIYGLKQASRSWNKRFDEGIKKFGFAQNLDEPCVYQKASGSNVTFLILYVDAIIIMGNHIPSFQSVKDYLGKCFAMKDLGETTFILGIKIYRDRSKRLIGLSQSAYMDKILKRYKMDDSKRGHIPMQERLDLNKTQGASTPEEVKRMQNVPYASVVGSIINPEAELETDRVDIKSQPVCIFILNGVPVDWKSSKQSTTAMSATEAEYIATSEAAMEAVWIRKFISGLGLTTRIMKYSYILIFSCLSSMSNSKELRHTDNTTLVPPKLPDTLPQVYHRRRPTLGLLILPSVSPFPPTIRRTARISIPPIEPNLAERAKISAINLDDYQFDPLTPPPSHSSLFTMAAYQRMIAETDLTQREKALTETGQLHTILEDMDRYPNACLEELEAFMTLWDVKPRVEESSLETLSMDELITQLRQMCEDAEDRASNAQEEARHKRKEALEEVVQQIYRTNN